ncbi:hypothetical protein [Mycobacterium sp. NAZ190054]|uniref:hypothetical protein n=1 Tax=Mycobacterium sp. NAZ190054 TaxID=1747766 RepID=UPI0012E3C0E7|nr:hypothetical protein [Mycobacterium sp. NAZ190054]
MAADETLPPPRWPDSGRNRGGFQPPEVLFDDNFDQGFCGWRDHQGAAFAYAPLSRTALRTLDGSSHSLVLSTGARPNSSANIPHAEVSAYKNLSRWVDSGLVKFETWIAQGGADLDNSPNSWFIGIDTQRWDNSSRGFFKLRFRKFTGSGEAPVRSDQWALTNDVGSFVNLSPNPPNAGDNENKMNFNYIALTVDLDTVVSSDGAPGSYHEAQVGADVYDLTGLGAGRGKQNPQIGSSVGAGSFAGGLNFGIGMTNNTVHTAAGPSWLLVGRVRGTWYPRSGA